MARRQRGSGRGAGVIAFTADHPNAPLGLYGMCEQERASCQTQVLSYDALYTVYCNSYINAHFSDTVVLKEGHIKHR